MRSVLMLFGLAVVMIFGQGSLFICTAAVFAAGENRVTLEVEEGFRLAGGWMAHADVMLLADGTYRVYFSDNSPTTGGHPAIIRSSLSEDGLNLVQESGILLGLGYGGQSNWATSSKTIQLEDGTYRMYYNDYEDGAHHINSAFSSDGIIWQRESGRRIDIDGPYDSVHVQSPDIVKLSDGTLRMYYSGRSGSGDHVLSAVSEDGLNWTKEDGIRLECGKFFCNDESVMRVADGSYIMFYAEGDVAASIGISAAHSTDGINFTQVAEHLVDEKAIPGGPFVYAAPCDIEQLSRNTFRLYFQGDRLTGPWTNRMDILSAVITIGNSPIADAGEDQTVECGSAVILDGSGSSDADGDELTYTWTGPFGTATGVNPTVNLPLGSHSIMLTVDDGTSETDMDEVFIIIEDTTAPALDVTVDSNVLWPPNHKLVEVTPSASVFDVCDNSVSVELVSVISDESDNGKDDGNTWGDIVVGSESLKLRAERSGYGEGRTYSITFRATDASGNSSYNSAQVFVPKKRVKERRTNR